MELKKVNKAYGDRQILKGFDYTFKKGDRIGIIGKNGVGKTTFLNILLGKEQPDSGKINPGETVVFGYFDQNGIELKEDMRILEYVLEFADNFTLADGTKVSATQFLQLYQFTPEQQFIYVSKLSGGERKRLQLLTVLVKSPNFLILVEPTKMTIQPIGFDQGRFFSTSEFTAWTNVCLIGFTNAEELFGSTESALGKHIDIKGKKATVVCVIKKEGTNFIGWDYDNCIMIPNNFSKQLFEEQWANPILIAKGKEGVSTAAFMDELKGIMRQIRRLSPTQDDNFSLNSVEAFSKAITGFFSVLNIVGAISGGISLVVGLFGIAYIMFVTVKERTGVIGLKKAVGAKKTEDELIPGLTGHAGAAAFIGRTLAPGWRTLSF